MLDSVYHFDLSLQKLAVKATIVLKSEILILLSLFNFNFSFRWFYTIVLQPRGIGSEIWRGLGFQSLYFFFKSNHDDLDFQNTMYDLFYEL